MKEIKFTPEMLQLIVDGKKFQTRRPMKPQPEHVDGGYFWPQFADWKFGWSEDNFEVEAPEGFCPYGDKYSRLFTSPDSEGFLEIETVEVQHLQDITDDEVHLEGIKQEWTCIHPGLGSYAHANHVKDDFQKLWDSIYSETDYKWSTNPWVWVITFKRIKA